MARAAPPSSFRNRPQPPANHYPRQPSAREASLLHELSHCVIPKELSAAAQPPASCSQDVGSVLGQEARTEQGEAGGGGGDWRLGEGGSMASLLEGCNHPNDLARWPTTQPGHGSG
ncbi:unnamed protein product [Lota lota]